MADTGDQQVEILRLIWNEVKATKVSLETRLETGLRTTREELCARIDQTREELGARIDGLGASIEQVNETVDAQGRRITESEMRLATATTELARDVHELSGLLREWRQEHRVDHKGLKRRVENLEDHAGLAAS